MGGFLGWLFYFFLPNPFCRRVLSAVCRFCRRELFAAASLRAAAQQFCQTGMPQQHHLAATPEFATTAA
jgi:hypothetical protein